MDISQENAQHTLEKVQRITGDLHKARATVDAVGKVLGCAENEVVVEKAAALVSELAKVAGERDQIRQALAKANGEIEALRKMPAAPKGAVRVVQRAQDNHELGTTLTALHEGRRNA